MPNSSGFEVGSHNATYEVVIFHGYTGSPDSFRELVQQIADECDARVTVPLLPGHGTKIEDLQQVTFEQFLEAGRASIRAATSTGKPLVLIGYCFGGYIAIMLAQECAPRALVVALTPFVRRLPFGLGIVAKFLAVRGSWSKFLYPSEKKMREPFFYYHRLPGGAQLLMNEGINRISKIVPQLTMPILTIHTTNDPTCRPESGAHILERSGHNPNNQSTTLPGRRHNLFFGPRKEEDISIVIEFLKKEFGQQSIKNYRRPSHCSRRRIEERSALLCWSGFWF